MAGRFTTNLGDGAQTKNLLTDNLNTTTITDINGQTGAPNQVLSSTVSGIDWVSGATTFPITDLNAGVVSYKVLADNSPSGAWAVTNLNITGNGRLGLGTTTPLAQLHIADPTNGFVGIRLEGSDDFIGSDFTIFASSDGPFPSNEDFLGIADSATNTYKMKIYKSGKILIGWTADQGPYILQVLGNTFIRTSDSLGTTNGFLLQNPLGTALLSVNNTGIVTMAGYTAGTITASASGVLSSVSDSRLKEPDGFITDALSKVMALKPRYFKWKPDNSAGLTDTNRQLGFFAQEVQSALGEEVVNTPPEGSNWGIYDRGMIAMLTKAVQELTERIVKLEIK